MKKAFYNIFANNSLIAFIVILSVFLAMAAILFSCANDKLSNSNKICIGMAKSDVVALIGKSEFALKEEKKETWFYGIEKYLKGSEFNGGKRMAYTGKVRFSVTFSNGTVCSINDAVVPPEVINVQ